MKPFLFAACFFGLATLAFGLPQVAIDIGEMPPLFSKAGGIVDRVVERALVLSGYEVAFHWWPVGRMLNLLDQGTSELYVTPSNTPGQQNPHQFLLGAQGVFFYKKNHAGSFKVTRWEDLAGKRVATVTNSPLRPLMEKAGVLVDEGPFETMFDKLEAERVDYACTADVGGIITIRQKFPGRESDFDFSELSYTEIKAGLFAQDTPEGRAVLDACRLGFAQMKRDGSLSKLLRDFFGPDHYRRVKIY